MLVKLSKMLLRVSEYKGWEIWKKPGESVVKSLHSFGLKKRLILPLPFVIEERILVSGYLLTSVFFITTMQINFRCPLRA